MNHEDCGAAKIANGKKEFTLSNEKKIHQKSFSNLKKNIKRNQSVGNKKLESLI